MSNINRYIEQEAARVESPLDFTSTTGAATVAAALATVNENIDLLRDLLTLEGTEITTKRHYLDEMSPVARVTLYKILTDLKEATVV